MAARDWLSLYFTPGLGPVLIRRLVHAVGSAELAASANARQLAALDRVGNAKAQTLAAALSAGRRRAEEELRRADKLGITILSPDDDSYPVLLRDVPDPPPTLWVLGELQPRDLNAVAVVGTRTPSGYGKEQARRFAALLAGAGFTVVSGGAYGVDTHAARGALSAMNGRTIAVLGCGVDVAYPPENGPLFDELIDGGGAVVSELPIGTQPRRENFPRRNRIISGMSRGVLVVEAAERSGALITARSAADDQGRPVFAVPGRVDNPMSAGPHKLLREGATLAASLDDITDNLGPLPVAAYEPVRAAEPELFPGGPDRPAAPLPELSEAERRVLAALDAGPAGADAVCDRSDLPAAKVRTALTMLSLKGLLRRQAGDTYMRK